MMMNYYLMFDRSCEEALKLYEKAFGGQIVEMQKFSDMPPNPNYPVAEENKDLVLHARLQIGEAMFMCSDSSGHTAPGSNMYISITGDKALVEGAWNDLKEGGKVEMDLTPTFFAELHGSLQDKFGINWMFTVEKPS